MASCAEDTKRSGTITRWPMGRMPVEPSANLPPLPLGAAFKRGLVITAANWPVVVIDFSMGSFYKLALSIPVLGGAVMVAAIVGSDLNVLLREENRTTADLVFSSLSAAPAALAGFLTGLVIVAIGGAVVVSVLKAGTLSVLVAGERASDDAHLEPFDTASIRRARAYSVAAVIRGATKFARRAVSLAMALTALYGGIVLGYLWLMRVGLGTDSAGARIPLWPVLVLGLTTLGAVIGALINLAIDLLRVIVVTDDCSVRTAARRLGRFVVADGRHLFGVCVLMGGVLTLATVVSLLAASGLTVIAWVPYVGFVIVPLQMAAWLVRGLVFEALALSALSSCQVQYRRFSYWGGEDRGAAR